MTENAWSAHDLEMIGHREVFLHKPAILKNAEARLRELESAMARELAKTAPALPPDTKIEKGQLARGENHRGFPYLSLDIPQFFSKTEMFTFRTLFWWGHYLGFSLILKGSALNRWLENLLTQKQAAPLQDVHLATAATPFEWSFESFKPAAATPEAQIRSIVKEIDHIKLVRVFPVESESFAALDWTGAGVQAWRDLSAIAVE